MQSNSEAHDQNCLHRLNFHLNNQKTDTSEESNLIALLDLLYKDSNGFQLSTGFRAPQFVYGELSSFQEYLSVFSHSKHLKSPSSVFCDLGCGLGKANLLIATCFKIQKSVGIEYINRLTQYANSRKRLLLNVFRKNNRRLSDVEFIRGDILNCWENWKDSDVLFINCVCWEKQMMRKLLRNFEGLKEGTEVFSTNVLNRKNLRLIKEVHCKTGWGESQIYLYAVKNCYN